MTWEEALEPAIAATNHERYRFLCSEACADRFYWRTKVIRIANGETTDFPSIATQARNLGGAIGRVVAAAVTGHPVKVSPEERDRRWALCMTCENLVNDRCKLCGCFFRAKIELATESCPLNPPRWERVEGNPDGR